MAGVSPAQRALGRARPMQDLSSLSLATPGSPAALSQAAAASAGATPSATVGASHTAAFPGVHYEFREKRRALVLLSAAATKRKVGKHGQLFWCPEFGQLRSLKELREECEKCGFDVIRKLGIDDNEKPTADDVRNFVKGIAEFNFSDYDGLMMVIASHGHEGHIWAWPNPSEDTKSGPVGLRDEIYSPIRANETLIGKPKVFLIESCRGAWGDDVTHVDDPLKPPAAKGDKGIYNGLKGKEQGQPADYHKPLELPDGTPVLGESDCLFGWSTVAFNTSGVTDERSLYLSAVVKQLRENPRRDLPLPLVNMLELTNGDMQREHVGPGLVADEVYPQCSLVLSTLRKVLYFDAPLLEAAASKMWVLRDVLQVVEQEDGPQLGVEKMNALRELVNIIEEQQRAKRQRTRAGNEEAAAIDTNALFESVKKIAQLVAGPSVLTGAAEAALQAACAALGQKVDGEVMGLLAPLRRELDALAKLPYDAPPRLTVAAPSEQKQQKSRSAVLEDIALEDDIRWTSIPAGEKLHLHMHCQQNGFCYLLHLNNEDQLSIMFPNEKHPENAVLADEVHKVQTRFKDVKHLERETFYLLTVSKKLEEFEAVGTLPAPREKLQGRQAQAVLAALRRVAGAAAATVRDLDVGLSAEMDGEDSELTMALSTMTIISETATAAQA